MPLEPRDDYTAPTWQDVGFEFTSGGYTAPSLENVSFQWFSMFTQVFNLGATIDPVKKHLDLHGAIAGFRGIQIPFNLGGILSGTPPVDMLAYLKAKYPSYAEMGGYIRAWHILDLGSFIRGIFETDLPTLIFGIGPVDLGAYVKAWYQTDLGATLVGWAELDLGGYLKTGTREYIDLTARMGVYVPRYLGARIKGWVREEPWNLGAYINPLGFADLGGYIKPFVLANIGATIYAIPYSALPAYIYGWAVLDLGGTINPIVDFRKDLGAVIGLIEPKALPAIIHGWAFRDLPAIIQSYNESDLGAIITSSGGYKDLIGIINIPSGSANLGAIITPRLIKLAVLLPIHTMEHLDLGALINLSPCYNLGIADLGAYMKIWQKHDLSATIYGFFNINSQLKDLQALITSGEKLYDLHAIDEIKFSFTPLDSVYLRDDLKFIMQPPVRPLDEIPIGFIPLGGRRIEANLLAAIIGHYTSSDLGATITAQTQAPYVFGHPIFGAWEIATEFGAPYIYKNRVLWERLVSIVFYSQVYDYFYQSISDSLWKSDTTQKWRLNVSSWLEEQDYLQDKKSLREKLVDDILEFESIDEAIRYAIDWVISFPTKDLKALIYGSTWWENATNPTMMDLVANIRSSGSVVYSNYLNLGARTTPFHTRNLAARLFIRDWWGDLGATLTVLLQDEMDLAASIQAIGWKNVLIDFDPGEGYVAPNFDDVGIGF